MRTRMRELSFVTSNANKLREFEAIMGGDFPIPLRSHAVDLVETQGEAVEIATRKCRAAAAVVGGPTITEDAGLEFAALRGLPGPYIKDFLTRLQPEGLHRLLQGYDDKRATAQCIYVLCMGDGSEPVPFVGRTDGTVVAPRGERNFGWDPIFQPDGFDQTYSEMPKETKNAISHRSKAVSALKAYLLAHIDDFRVPIDGE
jgi:inosine triphosphate pyrophosphatase